jgi:hypothetical protein
MPVVENPQRQPPSLRLINHNPFKAETVAAQFGDIHYRTFTSDRLDHMSEGEVRDFVRFRDWARSRFPKGTQFEGQVVTGQGLLAGEQRIVTMLNQTEGTITREAIVVSTLSGEDTIYIGDGIYWHVKTEMIDDATSYRAAQTSEILAYLMR